jgi:hypothetical protein
VANFLDTVAQGSASVAGALGSAVGPQNFLSLGALPLAANNVTLPNEDGFWVYSSFLDSNRWNQSFPYQLLVLDYENGSYSTVATFTLPIPPQELTLATPFAITTTATLGGIVEQHNGAPIRMLSISGTTGVLPGKPNLAALGNQTFAQSIFAGTISSLTQAALSVNQAALALQSLTNQGGTQQTPNVVTASETDQNGELANTTGYYQFRLMQQFLESYITAKKTDTGRSLRLAFAIWKDQAVYLVTPVSFDVRRSQSSPWEYNFALQMRLWKRINLDNQGNQPLNTVAGANTRNPDFLQELLTVVATVQNALQVQNLVDVLQAATGDAAVLLENIRSISAWGKDQLGAVYNLADLPDQIVNNLKGSVVAIFSNPNLLPSAFNQDFQAQLLTLGVSSGKAQTQLSNPGGVGQNLNTFVGQDAADPVNLIFSNPKENYSFFSSIRSGDISIPPGVQLQITAERNRVRQFRRIDFENFRDSMLQTASDFSDAVGAGDETYNRTFGRSGVINTTHLTTDDDYEVMFQLNSLIIQLDRLAAFNNLSAVPTNPMDFAAGFFQTAAIPFQSVPGKFAVPFPYQGTLERLAQQYLGDPDRWEEIAVLNDLRAPYVDEVGFDLPLLVNGNLNQVVVSDVTNLEVNQLVTLSSTTTSRTQRHILSITAISSNYFVLLLDGTADLGRFTTLGASSLHAYLPGTVNSQMTLYIPSAKPPPVPEFDTPAIPGLNPFQNYFNVGGVDVLLTSTGDLAVTPDGDCRQAIGLANIVQTIRLALNTPKGSLLHHPEYGFQVRPGTSVADLTATDLLNSTKDLFKGDPTFTGVRSAAIAITGPGAKISLGIGIAGANQIIPVTLDIH